MPNLDDKPRPGRLSEEMDKAARTDPAALMAEGWTLFKPNSFSELVGPFWTKGEGPDRIFGFVARADHGNGNGTVHGGMLMTFADNSLGNAVAASLRGTYCATIQLQLQFTAAARAGDFVICRPEIIRRSMTLFFMRGLLTVQDKTVASAEGVWKVLDHKPRGGG